jgi:spore coat polysaccharide biosynthesis protein SpsF
MDITAIIACRMGSSRFPGKTMSTILGKPMIERMIDRVSCSRHIKEICLATTDLPIDDELEFLAARLGILSFRGSEADVLGRIVGAAQHYKPDLIVELLGDNPLVHSSLIDDVIQFYCDSNLDYVASVTSEYPFAPKVLKKFPLGIRVQVFPRETIVRCGQLAEDSYYRENSTAFIAERPDLFRVGYFEAIGNWAKLNRPDLTFAVNIPKNLDLIARVFSKLYPQNKNFSLFDIFETIESDMRLLALMGNGEILKESS